MNSLMDRLLEAYERRKRDQSSCSFKIDDRDGDVSEFSCDINVTVTDAANGAFVLELIKAPHNPAAKELVENRGGQWNLDKGLGNVNITMKLTVHDADWVKEFGKAIRRVTARGERYLLKDWKFICPRTANSLEKLARVVRQRRARSSARRSD